MSLQLRQNLNLRMEQKLRLTPQMLQSIEILLLPQLALQDRLMREIERNPALEISEPEPEVQAPRDGGDLDGDFDADAWLLRTRTRTRDHDDDGPSKMEALAATPERPPTLADHLLEQLRFQELPAEVRELLPDICWQLDRRGYLPVPLSDLFPEDKLELAEQAWEAVRRCEPAGIGARDLRDCLLLQLQREPGDNTFEMRLVTDHLDDVLRNRLPAIAESMGVDVERVQEGVEVIGRLDPKPGLRFAPDENRLVVPDVRVERDETDEWVVAVNDDRLPKVRLSETYQQLADDPGVTTKDRAYLREQLSGARFLVDAVAQRKRTLLRIVTEIIKHQTAFLEQGPEQLRPLMRQDIADRVGMHVATVSRAVKDKYIQTPTGILPLAAFFSGGIATHDGGEAESSRSVKLRIQKLIQGEDPPNPLSDQEIADLLAKDGLDISRRTVTKYRIAEGIPSTRQRRTF